MQRLKLRGHKPRRNSPHELGELSEKFLGRFAQSIVHRIAVGHADLTGDDVATIFADAIGGVHRARPLGVADVEWNGCAWSVKTVKLDHPFRAKRVRLISGRNSPDFSAGLSDPRKDAQATGAAVLRIWNARIDEALKEHDDLRTFVLIRNMETREFLVFEDETSRFVPANYTWQFNKPDNRGNLEGVEKTTGRHCFTWQPHGSQLTVFREIPASARKFSIKRNIPTIEPNHIFQEIGFTGDWIDLKPPPD